MLKYYTSGVVYEVRTSIIKIFMHYETKKTYDDYNDKNPQGGHRRIIESFMKGEGIDTPSVVFENLELYEDSI